MMCLLGSCVISQTFYLLSKLFELFIDYISVYIFTLSRMLWQFNRSLNDLKMIILSFDSCMSMSCIAGICWIQLAITICFCSVCQNRVCSYFSRRRNYSPSALVTQEIVYEGNKVITVIFSIAKVNVLQLFQIMAQSLL